MKPLKRDMFISLISHFKLPNLSPFPLLPVEFRYHY